jgi:NAD(P)-dependent dehydrogenase (short-subunit alcohol dehydrogenase family)
MSTASATVVITGGTGGLGSAVTAAALADGWRVVVPYNQPRERERLEADERVRVHRERLELIEADLFQRAEVDGVVERAGAATDSPLRAVVNLVGGFAAGGRVHETPLERFEEQLQLNLRPTYLVTASALPQMLEVNDGAIVCVSTRAALRPFPGAAGYITSKAAVLAFVDALAAEYTRDGVRANAILPSVIDTPANRAEQPDADHSRWVLPEAIARVILFLMSPDSAPISGAHVPVYGRA